jgi:hypothetical protein
MSYALGMGALALAIGCGSSHDVTDAGRGGDAGPRSDGGGSDAGEDAGPGGPDAGFDAGVAPMTFTLGPEESGPWEFEGDIGLGAGHAACMAQGSDHVCDYGELFALSLRGEFADVPEGTKLWVQRTQRASIGGVIYEPSGASNCNDWTYASGDMRSGETAIVAGGVLVFDLDDTPVVGESGGAGACADTRFIPCCSAD